MKMDDTESRFSGDSGDDEQVPEPQNLIDFMQASPLAEAFASGGLDETMLERPRDLGREPLDFDWETDA